MDSGTSEYLKRHRIPLTSMTSPLGHSLRFVPVNRRLPLQYLRSACDVKQNSSRTVLSSMPPTRTTARVRPEWHLQLC